MPPFSAQEFFEIFRRYNEGVWPAQVVLLFLGLTAAAAAYHANARRVWWSARTALVLMAVLWAWSGIAYHKMYFEQLTPAAKLFGNLFVAEAALLLLCLAQNGNAFARVSTSAIVTGSVLIVYAIAAYPVTAPPSFGTPCPTTIFTFGMFCLLASIIPKFAVAIPVLWAAIGTSAAFALGVRQDIALMFAAAAALTVMHHETTHHEQRHAIVMDCGGASHRSLGPKSGDWRRRSP